MVKNPPVNSGDIRDSGSIPGSGRSPGVGCHALLQGIFLTQESNRGLPHCRQILCHMSYQGICLCMASTTTSPLLNISLSFCCCLPCVSLSAYVSLNSPPKRFGWFGSEQRPLLERALLIAHGYFSSTLNLIYCDLDHMIPSIEAYI